MAEGTNLKNREITYRVGWRKGSIHLDESGQIVRQSAHSGVDRSRQLMYWIERYAWLSMPALPDKYQSILLWALPAVSFGITILLVIALLE
jgi:cytochrome c-type biogenesis protein CcmH/NrfF